MNITVEISHQYGQQVVKPVCETAQIFCQIAGTKTLTPHLIKQIKSLGYTVEVKQTLPTTL
jgi:ribosomal protein S15P/S13E